MAGAALYNDLSRFHAGARIVEHEIDLALQKADDITTPLQARGPIVAPQFSPASAFSQLAR